MTYADIRKKRRYMYASSPILSKSSLSVTLNDEVTQLKMPMGSTGDRTLMDIEK